MSKSLKPLRLEPTPTITHRKWGSLAKPAPIPPLHERMPVKVPPRSTALSEDGSAFLTTTPHGTVIAWDVCGRCSVHVKVCRCSRPTAPRSVTYIWHQDAAQERGEEWSTSHPDYSREFPTYDHTPEKPRRRVRRRSR